MTDFGTKTLSLWIAVIAVMGFTMAGTLAPAAAEPPGQQSHRSGSLTTIGDGGNVPLVAGGEVPVGDVTVSASVDSIVVTYNVTAPGWVLNETHLEVADGEDDIPQTRPGNPKVGQFANGSSHPVEAGVTTVTFGVPRDTIEDTDADDTLAIAAHATVVNTTADPAVNETAWGDGADGAPFTDHGSWATYFAFNESA